MATEDNIEVKPTIVFVAGAWLPQESYEPFYETLRSIGYFVTGTDHPALDAPEPTAEKTSISANAAHLRQTILEPIIEDEGKDVVVVMHSYGGCVGCAAASGLSKRARQREGKKGGVVGLVMASAFVFPEGGNLGKLELWAGRPLDTTIPNEPREGLSVPNNPIDIFIHDAPRDFAEKYVSQAKPWSLAAFASLQPKSAHEEDDMEGLCAYIMFEDDKALIVRQQEGVINEGGGSWSVERIAGSHCYPFVDGTGKLAGVVDKVVTEFRKAI